MIDDLISITELCKILGFKKSYVYKLIHTGKLNYYKPFGKKVFFKRSELEEIFRSSKVSALSFSDSIKSEVDKYFMT